MKHLKITCILLLICCGAFAQGDSSRATPLIRFEKLLPGRMIPVFTADARAHRLQLLKATQGLSFYGSMGGQFPAADFRIMGKRLQLSAAATAYLTLKRYDQSGEVMNSDFFVDFYADLELTEKWYLRGSYGHTSHHLGDDALASGTPSVNYAKDYVQLQTVHRLMQKRMMIYAGFYYLHNFKIGEATGPRDLSGNVMLQGGLETDVYRFTSYFTTYIAADVKLRQEFDFGTTHNFQAGLKLHDKEGRQLRFAYNYLGGYEERGQFYKAQTDLHTIGLYFDF